MKVFDAILFDLDGTLIHMPQERFTRGTTELMASVAAPQLGMGKEEFIRVLWKGFLSTIANDGKKINSDVFFDATLRDFGGDREKVERCFDAYYRNEFDILKSITTENKDVQRVMREAHRVAEYVILATLPVFPTVAQKTRLGWIGLTIDDFDLVTDLANAHFCKPSPAYYREILDRFDLRPERTMMVGNDVSDDILPTLSLGMQSYLVTDYLLNGDLDAPGARKSSFVAFADYLQSL